MPFDGAMDATFVSLPLSNRYTLSAPGSSLVVFVGSLPRVPPDRVVGWQEPNVVGVNAHIERTRLRYLRTDCSVGVDGVNRNAAWVVVGHQHVARGPIAGDVDRT